VRNVSSPPQAPIFWVVTDDDFQTSFLDSDFTLSPKGFILH
jgi:hypothetical protein